jgi:hypothetical protein
VFVVYLLLTTLLGVRLVLSDNKTPQLSVSRSRKKTMSTSKGTVQLRTIAQCWLWAEGINAANPGNDPTGCFKSAKIGSTSLRAIYSPLIKSLALDSWISYRLRGVYVVSWRPRHLDNGVSGRQRHPSYGYFKRSLGLFFLHNRQIVPLCKFKDENSSLSCPQPIYSVCNDVSSSEGELCSSGSQASQSIENVS